MNQIMSGFTLTYSRSLRLGDFVKVGDIEGTVVHLGRLATKIKTARREEITIPNAVVVTNATTNYSRLADTEGVFVPTSITIGYDTPWRQVQALLLLAAARTGDLRKDPPPVVRQTALQDFYVQIHPAGLPRARGPALRRSRSAAREYSGRVQRVRSPDHLAELRGRPLGCQGRPEIPVVCRSRGA